MHGNKKFKRKYAYGYMISERGHLLFGMIFSDFVIQITDFAEMPWY
jgi:hypothetical protein